MFNSGSHSRRALHLGTVAALALLVSYPGTLLAQGQSGTRPMTFLDMQHMRRAGSETPSPDGQWMLYTVTTPDWQEADSQTDIYLDAPYTAGTWVPAAAPITIPGDATGTWTVVTYMSAVENVENDTTGTEFDGHGADDAWLFVLPD